MLALVLYFSYKEQLYYNKYNQLCQDLILMTILRLFFNFIG